MLPFFGLDPSDREKLLLEPWYLINKHCQGGMDWHTYYNFFVSYRRWLIKRIAEDLEAQAQALKERQHGPQMVSNGQPVSLPSGRKKFG